MTIQDEPGDALPDAEVSVSPDLHLVRVRIESDTFHLSAEYGPGTDLPATYLALSIDSDGSLITGEAIDGHGVDFVLAIGAGTGAQTNVVVLRYNVFSGQYALIPGPSPLVLTENGLAAKVPLGLLGGLSGDGRMTVRASTHHRLPATETEPARWTAVLDFAPDEGLPPTVVE